MTKKHITLYNLIFPIWLLWVIPTTWIVVLPVNFLIDITVVMLTLKYAFLGSTDEEVIPRPFCRCAWNGRRPC